MDKLEQETTVVFNDKEEEAKVWSASSFFQRKMEKLGVKPDKIERIDDIHFSIWYRLPKAWVRIRKPRIMSEKQKRIAKENLIARLR